MRCQKLFSTFDVRDGRYLAVRATPGNGRLGPLAVPLVRQTLACGRPDSLHGRFDAAAGQADAGVRAWCDLVEQEPPRLDVTRRACRYPHRRRAWKALDSGLFVPHQEPGPYVGAAAREVRLAETLTVLKDESPEQAVRTIVCREVVRGPKKDRWHPLLTTSLGEVDEVLGLFRLRPYHEQAYRVGVYDESLDRVPCGYDQQSPDPKRPRWPRGPLQRIGWLVALVYNAVADFAEALEGDCAGCQVRTLRRMFFNRPGQLYATPEALIVCLDPFAGQEALVPVIDAVNVAGHRLPWLDNRGLVMSLTPRQQQRAGP